MMKTHVKQPEWSKNLSIYEVNVRQYTPGGTFKELEAHIPRLKELGVGFLWFMPIQPIGEKNRKGSLGSYYSIKDYTAVNPAYGTLDEFKQLVKKIHDAGMYVLLDWVANHTAWDSVWSVQHPDFFTKDEFGNFKPPVPDWADVIDLNFSNKELWTYMIEALKFWITETDIDGFRCDMAHLVPTEFWNTARAELDKTKEIFMLAESENRDLLEKAFNMEYNWNIFHIINSIAKGERNVNDLDNILQYEIHDFPENAYQMFFTSNHDENSWNGSAIERLGFALEVFNAMMFTIDGMPLIYSGQEAGMYKRLKFFDKDLIEWKEDKMFRFYKTLIDLKKRNKALWNGKFGGSFSRIDTSNNSNIFAYLRKKDNKQVVAVLNLSNTEQMVTLFGNSYTGQYTNVFTHEKVMVEKDARIFLKPWDYRIYEM